MRDNLGPLVPPWGCWLSWSGLGQHQRATADELGAWLIDFAGSTDIFRTALFVGMIAKIVLEEGGEGCILPGFSNRFAAHGACRARIATGGLRDEPALGARAAVCVQAVEEGDRVEEDVGADLKFLFFVFFCVQSSEGVSIRSRKDGGCYIPSRLAPFRSNFRATSPLHPGA